MVSSRILKSVIKTPEFRKYEKAYSKEDEKYSEYHKRLEKIEEGYPDVGGSLNDYTYSQLPQFETVEQGEYLIRFYEMEIRNIEDQLERSKLVWKQSDPAPRRYMERFDTKGKFFDEELTLRFESPEDAFLDWTEKSLSAITLKRNLIYLIRERLIEMMDARKTLEQEFEELKQEVKALYKVVFVEE